MGHVAPESNGRLSKGDAARLDALYERLCRERSVFVGYPVSAAFDYSPLYRFLEFPSNNVGDPFVPSNYHLNTHEFEREVLAEFMDLTAATAGDAWGYITSGGTEGNLYGIFLARELYPDGMVYYSEDTHYSVNKILRALHVRNIMIRSRDDGRIDLEDLRETLQIHRDLPPILFLNVGTTMKGAIDDLTGVNEILDDLAIGRRYIHADAALHGMILPFVDRPQPWNFEAGVDSISISGHKFIGAPFPCGVAIAKRRTVERIARSIEYVGSLDTTLSGSRNGLAALFLWYALRTTSRGEFRRVVAQCLDVADYAIDQLEALGRNPWRHENSPIVVFDRPPESIMNRWQIAVHGGIGHVIAMPHVTREQIDRLADDLAAAQPEEARSS